MAGWSGFSEEELRKLQQKDQAVPAALGRGRKPASTNRSRQQLQRERALQLATQQKSGPDSSALPPEQQLTKPPPQPTKALPKAVIQPIVTPTKPVEEPSQKETLAVNHAPAPAEDTSPIVKELEKQEVEFREKTRIELLQQDQKMMEDRNKRKKALLTKTIAEKSKQTQAESVKLKRIQKDLQTLDNMVSNDICILRGVIEQASWDYNTARKRYEKAESEYVTAKLDLHKKTEIKEQLTEHLCAIIQQNELRKAHKLEELLQQLHLQATEEDQEEERKREEEERKREEEERKREEEERKREEEERKREEEERKREEEERKREEEERKREEEERKREEEERKQKSVMENQGETNEQSPPDTGSTPGVETETQAGGAMLQQDYPAVTGSDQDCKTANIPLAGQSEAEAPASAS
nr:RAB6-interacting golgin isoform X2 [Oncorhynchus gorbuscha]XP_046158424.1 RAB6-interacting golgin isoform X2 [Oncorhynchus gorbuscha]